MPDINYKALEEYLKEPQGRDFFPVYLIFGEESLFKTAFNTLLDALLPLSERGFNYDPMDGTDDNIQTVIERMNTFSLLSGTKVISFLESRIFYSKQDYGKLFEKAKAAFYDDDLKAAAGEVPSEGREAWLDTLKKSFFRFRAHVIHRIALEEIGGFLDHVVETRPALARDVGHLRQEHRDLLASIEQLHQSLGATSPDEMDRLRHIRLRIHHLLSAVTHQAEHEDLLMSFVYTDDLGGEG